MLIIMIIITNIIVKHLWSCLVITIAVLIIIIIITGLILVSIILVLYCLVIIYHHYYSFDFHFQGVVVMKMSVNNFHYNGMYVLYHYSFSLCDMLYLKSKSHLISQKTVHPSTS